MSHKKCSKNSIRNATICLGKVLSIKPFKLTLIFALIQMLDWAFPYPSEPPFRLLL